MAIGGPGVPKVCSLCGAVGVNSRTCTGSPHTHEALAQGWHERDNSARAAAARRSHRNTRDMIDEVVEEEADYEDDFNHEAFTQAFLDSAMTGTVELRVVDETPVHQTVASLVNFQFVARYPATVIQQLSVFLDELPNAYFVDADRKELREWVE